MQSMCWWSRRRHPRHALPAQPLRPRCTGGHPQAVCRAASAVRLLRCCQRQQPPRRARRRRRVRRALRARRGSRCRRPVARRRPRCRGRAQLQPARCRPRPPRRCRRRRSRHPAHRRRRHRRRWRRRRAWRHCSAAPGSWTLLLRSAHNAPPRLKRWRSICLPWRACAALRPARSPLARAPPRWARGLRGQGMRCWLARSLRALLHRQQPRRARRRPQLARLARRRLAAPRAGRTCRLARRHPYRTAGNWRTQPQWRSDDKAARKSCWAALRLR